MVFDSELKFSVGDEVIVKTFKDECKGEILETEFKLLVKNGIVEEVKRYYIRYGKKEGQFYKTWFNEDKVRYRFEFDDKFEYGLHSLLIDIALKGLNESKSSEEKHTYHEMLEQLHNEREQFKLNK